MTDRLSVGPWHTVATEDDMDLAAAVAQILTQRTTESLPSDWQGEYSVERAQGWIAERDGESEALLVTDRYSHEPVGVMILHQTAPAPGAPKHIRIGYVITEALWGQGIASELVAGLVAWARSQPLVGSIIGGVEARNGPSARVLTKNGFSLTDHDPIGDTDTYTLELRS